MMIVIVYLGHHGNHIMSVIKQPRHVLFNARSRVYFITHVNGPAIST